MPVLTRIIGFVTTSNPEKAKAFYGDVLGFRLINEDNFALAYDANGTMIRARPEVAMLSDAMRHAQSLLGELMLNPAAALRIASGHKQADGGFDDF